MRDFCLIVTTRGRPDNWMRLSAMLAATIADDVDVWLTLDRDDPTLWNYNFHGADQVHIGGRLGHVGSLNQQARRAVADGYQIVGQMGDDHVPRTYGWDLCVREVLATPGIAYGNDLLQGEHLPTAVFMHSAVIQATGKFAPEGLWHLYADNYWRDLGRAAGCLHYMPGVVIEHMHPIAAKSEWDQTYLESNASEVDRSDARTWHDYQTMQLDHDVAKVKAAL
jgi:hypothetical protein